MVEERYLDLNEEEDIILDAVREDSWRDISEEGENKKKIHDMRWEVYVKKKEDLIKRDFLDV